MNVPFKTNAEPYPDPNFDGIQIHEGTILNYHKKEKMEEISCFVVQDVHIGELEP
jgi:hypothetical protein